MKAVHGETNLAVAFAASGWVSVTGIVPVWGREVREGGHSDVQVHLGAEEIWEAAVR